MQTFLRPLSALKTKTGYSVLAGMLVIIFSAWLVLDASKAEVVLAADGDVQTVKTDTATVGELLEDLGIDVGIYDELSHEKGTQIVDGMEIRFETANEILLTIDGETEEFNSTAITVGQFLEEEELEFSRYDDISHSNIEILDEETEIIVNTAVPVTLNVGGEEEEIQATADTVEDLLEEEDIEYSKSDRIEPGLDKKVKKDMDIAVVRVETKEEDVEEKIPFESIEKDDDSMVKGDSEVTKEGKAGKLRKTYEITLENGEEVGRELVDEEVLEESKDKVVKVGTKEPETEPAAKSSGSGSEKSSESNGGSGKTMTMEATAYGPDCAGCSGVSATGMNLKSGPKVIAVDPSVIPLGSKVWVEGYGEAIAADTGGAIKGNRIDVLMKSEAQASSNWGRRTVQVKVLD